MADIVSRAFKELKTIFLLVVLSHISIIASLFHITSFVEECHIPTKWVSRVISFLYGKQFQMAWLQILPKISKNTCIIGVTTPISAQLILSSPTSPAPSNVMSLLQYSLLGSGELCTAKTLQLKFRDLRTLFRPSPRLSNWLET